VTAWWHCVVQWAVQPVVAMLAVYIAARMVPPAAMPTPEQMPGRTAAGNLALDKITQADKADFFEQFVCGQILVPLREEVAVAPRISSA